jgi:hypothetical protein
MTYSDQQFGHDLLAQLEGGYDPIRVGKWAFTVWKMDPDRRHRSPAVEQCLGDLAVMEEGPEFEIPELEVRAMAQRLLESVDRPIRPRRRKGGGR